MKYLLYSSPMVRALLAGRKSCTRRLVKPQPSADWQPHLWGEVHRKVNGEVVEPLKPRDVLGWGPCNADGDEAHVCPLKVGDIFGVRETWQMCDEVPHPAGLSDTYITAPIYKADLPDWDGGGWKPSIHMPAWAVRLFYRVTEVKVERVQDISEADAIAEGVEKEPLMPVNGARQPWKRYDEQACAATSAVHSFYTLWKSINGHESWEANPWVWCYRFERCERPAP